VPALGVASELISKRGLLCLVSALCRNTLFVSALLDVNRFFEGLPPQLTKAGLSSCLSGKHWDLDTNARSLS
jgi:hypothetical protein